MEQLSDSLVSWASILDPSAREQALLASTMPFIHPHLALMPDAHLGKGATVGSVIPTDGAIMPAAVGVDIGCGMDAVRTQLTRHDLKSAGPLARVRTGIEQAVPLSAGAYNKKLRDGRTEARIAELERQADAAEFDPADYTKNWRLQLGSLGSGNHFIEVCVDEDDQVWLFLHSGSRGVGNKIAMHHIRVAVDVCHHRGVDLPDRDLAYLEEDSPEFWAYIRQMRWAQEFARLNRAEMMDRVVDVVSDHVGTPVQRRDEVSCHHNYTEQEEHFGRRVWLSRKGAINAADGVWGLIPGSMGDKSYVVVGKGNKQSLRSAPHGAGRNYSRRAARRTFTMDDLAKRMKGIEWSGSKEFLDEHPKAYKPIDRVMADAADLVDVRHTLRQILNVKGD